MPILFLQSSIQIAFDEVPQLAPRTSISHVTCIDQAEHTMVRVLPSLSVLGEQGGCQGSPLVNDSFFILGEMVTLGHAQGLFSALC